MPDVYELAELLYNELKVTPNVYISDGLDLTTVTLDGEFNLIEIAKSIAVKLIVYQTESLS